MARKKNTGAAASTARRPPSARDLAAERETQQLRSLNSRLVSETVKLRKQLGLLLTTNTASSDFTTTAASTAGRRVKGIRRSRAARHATIAAVKAANPASPIAPATCTADPIQQDTVADLISGKTSSPAVEEEVLLQKEGLFATKKLSP